MTGMEHTIERAAEVIDEILCADPQVAREMFGDEPDKIARALHEAGLLAPAPIREAITIPRPHVPHGPKHLTAEQADADYLREAAQTLDEFYKPFGSNLRATVVKLLHDAADAVDRAEGDGSAET